MRVNIFNKEPTNDVVVVVGFSLCDDRIFRQQRAQCHRNLCLEQLCGDLQQTSAKTVLTLIISIIKIFHLHTHIDYNFVYRLNTVQLFN